MDRRILKRFRREHRSNHRKGTVSEWRFHLAQWADLEVSVMPRTVDGEVFDSNTGVVVHAPHHGALRGCIVVSNASRPNCDEEALNYTITGSRNKYWADVPGIQPYCIPHRIVTPAERENEGYKMAVEAMMQGRGLTREAAEATADKVLGWCPDSIQCGACSLLIPGLGDEKLVHLARQYGWKLNVPIMAQDSWRCPACGRHDTPEIPSDDAFAAMFWSRMGISPGYKAQSGSRDSVL